MRFAVDRKLFSAKDRLRRSPLSRQNINLNLHCFRLGIVARAAGTILFCVLPVATFFCAKLAHAQSGATATAGTTPNTTDPIVYHGGPIIAGPHDVYFIWYGNWSGNTATSILPDLINGLNGSAYFNVNSVYTDSTGAFVDDFVSLNGQAFDNYSQGSSLGTVQVFDIVNTALVNGSVPYDANGTYFVLTSPDVTQIGLPGQPGSFCQNYCGWHYYGWFENRLGRIAFVGNPASQCPSGHLPFCSAQGVTPNGNEGADAMANVIAHELSETVTDPYFLSWNDDTDQQENGDKCNFMFGPTFTAPNGAQANITLSGRNFLIQELWTNANGCVMSLPPPPPPSTDPPPDPEPIPELLPPEL